MAVWYCDEKGVVDSPRNAWFEVEWRGHALDVVIMNWCSNQPSYHWIVASSAEVARGFYSAVCSHKAEVVDEVMVFDGGGWTARSVGRPSTT